MRTQLFLQLSKACLLCFTVTGTTVAAQNKSAADWGLDLRLQHAQQTFDDADAQLSTLMLQPYVQFDNWDISLNLPWQNIEGEYFVNGFQPTPYRICERLSGLTLLQRQLLLRRGRITEQQLAYCDNQVAESTAVDNSVSGISDISLAVRYALPLDQKGIWLGSVGVGYKWDNGDVATGIGSGTRDTTVDFALSFLHGQWHGHLAAGYVWVAGELALGTPGEEDYQLYHYDNYAYATLDSGYKIARWLTLGASVNTQQAYIPDGDDVNWLSIYANFSISKKMRLRIYMHDYLDVVAYPEQEIGASLGYAF